MEHKLLTTELLMSKLVHLHVFAAVYYIVVQVHEPNQDSILYCYILFV